MGMYSLQVCTCTCTFAYVYMFAHVYMMCIDILIIYITHQKSTFFRKQKTDVLTCFSGDKRYFEGIYCLH